MNLKNIFLLIAIITGAIAGRCVKDNRSDEIKPVLDDEKEHDDKTVGTGGLGPGIPAGTPPISRKNNKKWGSIDKK